MQLITRPEIFRYLLFACQNCLRTEYGPKKMDVVAFVSASHGIASEVPHPTMAGVLFTILLRTITQVTSAYNTVQTPTHHLVMSCHSLVPSAPQSNARAQLATSRT